MSAVKKLRCAIYTRKSTEEGLDQEFNSLDAQHEACAAYIASQAGLGWKLVPDRYDDGGISGGTMERPALQRLLRDIRDRKIDVVVVYKIDRLTRSLMDFSRIVEVLDAGDASFVSVTQQFNTTTSMGRLTLNVLLSFAQFEREVTAERIRDKIAASKRKGMWMGGTVPLGYEVHDRKLIAKEPEANFVRRLFSHYLELGSVPRLVAEVNRATTLRLSSSASKEAGAAGPDAEGRSAARQDGAAEAGGRLRRPMRPGMLYKVLANPLYVGKVRHRQTIYDGEHEAIVDIELFDRVQQRLAEGAATPKGSPAHRDIHLLTGLVFDETGDRLAPTHAGAHGRRYRYYVSSRIRAAQNTSDDAWRIPAGELEQLVTGFAVRMLSNRAEVARWIGQQASTDMIPSGLGRLGHLADRLSAEHPAPDRRAILQCIFKSITLSKTVIRFKVSPKAIVDALLEQDRGSGNPSGSPDIRLGDDDADPDDAHSDTATIDMPVTLKRRGNEMRLVMDSQLQPYREPDPSLVELVARAHLYLDRLTSSPNASSSTIAKEFSIDRADVGRVLPLAFLSPSMLEAILTGRQSPSLTARRLSRIDLPLPWAEQEALLR